MRDRITCESSIRTCKLGADILVWHGGDCGVCVVGKIALGLQEETKEEIIG